jgi:hypothetical protein
MAGASHLQGGGVAMNLALARGSVVRVIFKKEVLNGTEF